MIDIEDLITPSTTDDVKESLYETADLLGLNTTSWVSGSVLRTFMAIVAVVLAGFSSLVDTIARAGFLDTAVSGWLTLLARYVYAVERVEQTYGSGTVTLTNTGSGVFALDPGEFQVAHASTGKVYTNTAAIALGAFATVNVDVIALEGGTESNAAAGTLTDIQTSMADVTCTNAADIVATDEETDEDLRERCRDSLGALSPNGPAAAYEYVAKTPSLVGGAAITRVALGTPPGDGTLTVYLADADGVVSGGDVALVQAGFDEWATPSTATVTASSAVGVSVTFSVTIWVDAGMGLTGAAWQTLVKQTIVDWINTLPIGGLTTSTTGIQWRKVIGVVEALKGVHEAKLLSEVDIPLAENNVATCGLGDVTVTVNQV